MNGNYDHGSKCDEHDPMNGNYEHGSKCDEHDPMNGNNEHGSKCDEHDPMNGNYEHGSKCDKHDPMNRNNEHGSKCDEHDPMNGNYDNGVKCDEHDPMNGNYEHGSKCDEHDSMNRNYDWCEHGSRCDSLEGLAVLCAERVTQMTRTYNDIEAVTRLLEEKERDAELAARIGQTLLKKNIDLTEKNENLEEELHAANDRLNQLKHDVSMKDELLRAYTQDDDESSRSGDESPGPYSNLDVEFMSKRVKTLEGENSYLRLETDKLHSTTDRLEDLETRLISDCVQNLSDANAQLSAAREELAKKTEETMNQSEEITHLLAQVVDLQKRIKNITIENMELQTHLGAAQDSQRQLTKELRELQDRYDQLFEMLEEAQGELKMLRRKQKPGAVKRHYMSSSAYLPTDSLASELENSMHEDSDFPEGFAPAEKKVHNWKIFETARAAKIASFKRATSSSKQFLRIPGSSRNSNSGNESGDSNSTSVRSSMYLSDNESTGDSTVGDGYYGDSDSIQSSVVSLGRPGIPGSNDLETALRRLSLRRANELNEKDYKSEEDMRSSYTHSSMRMDTDDSRTPPTYFRSPDSRMSRGSSGSNLTGASGSSGLHYKLPDKLQIIKPMEGSVTLRQWQQLATPHMARIFESQPGVQTKGERKIETEEETYNWSDVEEDDDNEYLECPSKCFVEDRSVYTLTNSTVKHPAEQFEPQVHSTPRYIASDEIVTVIRKVDDNWLEGRKSDKIGIFPISFVELNDAAKTLINLKFSKSSAGATTDGLSLPSSPPQNPSVVAIQLPQQKRHSLTLSSQSSTSPPVLNRRSLELSSVSLPVTTNVPDLMSFPPLNSDSGVTTTATTSATKTTSSTDQVGGAALVTSVSPAAVTSTSPSVAPSSAEGATAITSPVPAIPPSCTTPPYVAMYNYKPQKEDEVELRKGDYYSVSEKCQDGWFKGQCLKNGNSGVFPGNYVQIVRPSSALKAASSNVLNIRAKLPTTTTTAVTTTATCATSVTSPSVTTTNAGASVVPPAPVTIKSLAENEASGIQPLSAASPPIAFTKQTAPPLAPRASRLPLPPPPPASHLITTSPPIVHSRPKSQIQSSSSSPSSVVYSRPSSSHLSQLSILSNNGKTVHVPAGVKKSLVSRGTSVQQSVNTTILPPNVVIGATGSQPLLPASREKKEKKDKEKLSLVKRLTAGKIRKSKLSESEIGSTSDGTVVHIRSGSFPSVISGDSSPGSSTPEIGMHKKSGSLDATAQVKSKTSKPGLRERFRCIVPYPPQSDMELELKLGDVVFVYKKRDDGWYKGTLQRSGKTGHFPGSFVEKCD